MIRWVLIVLVTISSCEIFQVNPEYIRTHSVDTLFVRSIDTIWQTLPYEFASSLPLNKIQRKLEIKLVEKEVVKEVVKTVYGDPGQVVYSVPDSMLIGQTYRVRVRIQKGRTISTQGMMKPISSQIRTSSRMSVDLVDPSPGTFKIDKLNGQDQIIESDHYTEWNFSVTPQKAGKRMLMLKVNLYTENGSKELVFEDEIVVKNRISVHVRTFWEDNWQWVFSALLIPIFMYFWSRKKKSVVGFF